MSTILESFEVDSPEHRKTFRIDLVEGLDDKHIEFIEQRWQPILQRQYDSALLKFFQLPAALQTRDAWDKIVGELGVPDAHWKWRTKCEVAPATNRRIYALLNGDDVEAAMCLLFGRNCRSTNPLPIVYVDYVAVAPWNRKLIQNPLRFQRFGTVMLGAAVAISKSTGLDGRCGLHSLPQSEGFYRHVGMSDLGIDADYMSLRYFEFNDRTAATFLERGNL